MTNREEILNILELEDIRRFDGRYSTGFVDLAELEEMIDLNEVQVIKISGMDFVKFLEK